jgi:hypothetical protein
VAFIAEVLSQFRLHGAFKHGFSQLLEQTAFAQNLFGCLVVFQQIINELVFNGHRDSFVKNKSLVPTTTGTELFIPSV